MRKSWEAPPSGDESDPPWLCLHPESESEAKLTSVEYALLQVSLKQEILTDPRVQAQLDQVIVNDRTFTHFGFFVHLRLKTAAESVPIIQTGGHAHAGWRDREGMLGTVRFAENGRLVCLEGYTVVGWPDPDDNWTNEDCIRLLEASLDKVWISP